ncbi:MAG TPA: alpha/beta fold hydrolase [Noviherbaspirillum sp.]|uniref:alpha/beta hydrolase family protein n=1 Tax=Noviherbaspirillum sp. TaxID=1926288 RepID=UPI002D2EB06A|nr:alpha/beta fold hydrolase [Noviherbaspirillum sp.]HYD96032.1 alpha/beta fold hydrolase [Noviherbaspirillum sp.]
MESTTILASDGFTLAATRFVPAAAPKAVVVLPCAMGIRQDFYFPFAQFLAQQGFAVLTFDYRGAGASVPEKHRRSLRGLQADLFIWAERDYNAALRVAKEWQRNLPLLVVGHSLGGQLPGLLPDRDLIDGILTVAAGSGYWRHNVPKLKRYVWFMWYVAVPLCTPLFGYFPGKRLRMVGDLPRGVVYQWSRWCRHPDYVVDGKGRLIRDGFDRIRVPVLSLSFTDDELLSRKSIDRLHGIYRNAPVERRHIAPADVQARRIGHFGFFRPEFRTTLWRQAQEWLEQCAARNAGRWPHLQVRSA